MTRTNLDYTNHICELEGLRASYYALNTAGLKAHFYGGNGLPTPVYDELLQKLSSKFHLSSLDFRACWPDNKVPSGPQKWTLYTDDLINFLESYYSEPVVSIAHSQGAHASIVAAYRRPDLFKKLILIDPVSVTISQQLRIRLIPWFIKKRVQPFKNTLNKSDEWDAPSTFFNYLRGNRVFKRFSDTQLQYFTVNALLKTGEEQYRLLFPAKWEAYNYALPINIDRYIAGLKVPFNIIGGRPSLFFSSTIRKKWRKLIPQNSMNITMDYGHLLPIEAPGVCAKMILESY